MSDFLIYLENIDFFAIIDLVVILTLSIVFLVFFKRRNNQKLALLLMLYMTIYAGVNVATAMTDNNILYVTGRILDAGIIFIIVAFCVVYQQDLKSMVARFGKWHEPKDVISYGNNVDDLRHAATEIVKACQTLSKNDIGALIVITPNTIPNHLLDTGTVLNARVSNGLVQSIFNTKAPLHDGAVIIKENVILGAGCFLPICQREDISKELGTRHRAAIGITEESDVLAIVVSEETGIISVVKRGVIKRYMTPEKLMEEIEKAFGVTYFKNKPKKR